MARARNIKPGFFKNEYLAELPFAARILFAGLWTLSDRGGRLEDRPKKIKAEILPYDDCDVDDLLNKLANSPERFIVRYEVDGRRYIAIRKFVEHQNPHIKEAASVIPAPDKHCAGTVQEQNQYGISPADSPMPPCPHADSPMPHADSSNMSGTVPDDIEKPPVGEIIDYLNEQARTKFKASSESTRRHIVARWNQGYRLDDFKAVIDVKTGEWMDTEWEKFLRPTTLFGTKFEDYLNQKTRAPTGRRMPRGFADVQDAMRSDSE